ncbi:MAG: DUF554 domain-containing protein [Actinomycetota bacterium]|nr:DUF554 domain-containing protein [Actinomycetota bacterium]
MRGLGTIVNVATVLAGAVIGLVVGHRLPERLRLIALQGVGLVTLVLGVQEASRTRNLAFPLGSVVLGGLVGEALGIEDGLERLGHRFQQIAAKHSGTGQHETFAEGFVTATLIFCVGPLTILGSISDGLGLGAQQLFVKSALDGTVAVVLASTLGAGVALSAVSVLVIQGLLTVAAAGLHAVLTGRMIAETTATGGTMIVGIALRILEIKRVRVGSFLPALVIAPVAVALLAR